MRAFIFGTFNPVTNAHIQMGITAKKVLGDQCEIIYVPTSDTYIRNAKHYEEGSILSSDIRIKLLMEAVTPYGFNVSTVEIDSITDGKTYNTLEYLGSDDSVLCIGMDNVSKIKKWYKRKDLLQKYRLLIFKRGTYCGRLPDILNESVGYDITFLDTEYAGISSTLVRKLYIDNEHDKLKELVPPNVFKYLKETDNVYF